MVIKKTPLLCCSLQGRFTVLISLTLLVALARTNADTVTGNEAGNGADSISDTGANKGTGSAAASSNDASAASNNDASAASSNDANTAGSDGANSASGKSTTGYTRTDLYIIGNTNEYTSDHEHCRWRSGPGCGFMKIDWCNSNFQPGGCWNEHKICKSGSSCGTNGNSNICRCWGCAACIWSPCGLGLPVACL